MKIDGKAKKPVQIFNANGTLIEQKALSITRETKSVTISFNLASQASGVYFIKLIGDDGVQTGKVVLMH